VHSSPLPNFVSFETTPPALVPALHENECGPSKEPAAIFLNAAKRRLGWLPRPFLQPT